MNWADCVTIDYETAAIQDGRPHFPPAPCGVAVKWGCGPSRYYAFAHPAANNCTEAEAVAELNRVWDSGQPVCAFNLKFDLSVAHEKNRLPWLPWQRTHDPMFLAYLADPHARTLGLKPLAADWLKWAPEERTAVDDWLWERRAQLVAAYGGNVTKTNLGGWISKAPGGLVGTYACGDTDRAYALLQHLGPIIEKNGMLPAYQRELKLLPILAENERLGMRVDAAELENDIAVYDTTMVVVENKLRARLGAPDLNFDADADVAEALIRSGVVLESSFALTKTGKLSTSKEYLTPDLFTDPAVASALGYRNRLTTCLNTFMKPWLEQASQWGGKIGTNWNQVRGEGGGTRTGRPSTNRHNFLNLAKSFEGRDDGYAHPAFLGLPQLPLVRKYVLPDEGQVFLHRDFSGQELRVFAHLEQGDLYRQYHANPALDPHKFVGQQLMGVACREIERTKVKTLNFQALYGGGVPALQKKLRCSGTEAKELKAFHDKALPGRKALNDVIRDIFARQEPIRTWGGRMYYCEEPGMSKKHGRFMTYEYKGINYVIQGSAADITKQAIIDWYPGRGGSRLLVQVYDEIDLSAPIETAPRDMAWLKEVMEAPRLSVPMLSDPKHGPTWGDAERCPPEKGCPLCQ